MSLHTFTPVWELKLRPTATYSPKRNWIGLGRHLFGPQSQLALLQGQRIYSKATGLYCSMFCCITLYYVVLYCTPRTIIVHALSPKSGYSNPLLRPEWILRHGVSWNHRASKKAIIIRQTSHDRDLDSSIARPAGILNSSSMTGIVRTPGVDNP